MPLPVREVLDMIADNTRRRGCPVPLPEGDSYRWADGLSIPRGGDEVLFTGLLYQLTPHIDSLVNYLEGLERSSVATLAIRLGRIAGKVVDVTKIASPPRERVEEQNGVIRNIAMLLMRSGVSFGYVYEDDMYSGALLYDLGLEEDFELHAKRVHGRLRERGVRSLITIDPHTTHVMREVYPKFLDGYDLEVRNYLEVLAERGLVGRRLGREVTIHDPCLYARYEGIVEQPRGLLESIGVEVKEPERCRNMTFCCGGPVESLSPGLSKGIASLRMEELARHGSEVLTMCPICHSSFLRVRPEGVRLRDLSSCLAEGVGL
ncbi:MAG: (Fe-S)-binding protein [Candidatus Korarchaeum sp.]